MALSISVQLPAGDNYEANAAYVRSRLEAEYPNATVNVSSGESTSNSIDAADMEELDAVTAFLESVLANLDSPTP